MAGRVQSMNYRDGRSTPYFNRYSSILGYRGVYIGLTPRCITIGMFWTGKLDLACIIYSVLSTMLSSVPRSIYSADSGHHFQKSIRSRRRVTELVLWFVAIWRFFATAFGCDWLRCASGIFTGIGM